MNKILLPCIFTCLFTSYFILHGMEDKQDIENSGMNTIDEKGNSPLFYAVQNNNRGMTRYLLEQKANPNSDELYYREKTTPLILAVSTQSLKLVTLLLEYKANINASDENGNTSLHHAVENLIKYDSVYTTTILTTLLQEKDIQKGQTNKEDATPLLFAVKADRLDIVKKLLQDTSSNDNSEKNTIPNIAESNFYE